MSFESGRRRHGPQASRANRARLLKQRHFAKGATVIMEGTGGAAFFIIDSGVSSKGVTLANLGPGDRRSLQATM